MHNLQLKLDITLWLRAHTYREGYHSWRLWRRRGSMSRKTCKSCKEAAGWPPVRPRPHARCHTSSGQDRTGRSWSNVQTAGRFAGHAPADLADRTPTSDHRHRSTPAGRRSEILTSSSHSPGCDGTGSSSSAWREGRRQTGTTDASRTGLPGWAQGPSRHRTWCSWGRRAVRWLMAQAQTAGVVVGSRPRTSSLPTSLGLTQPTGSVTKPSRLVWDWRRPSAVDPTRRRSRSVPHPADTSPHLQTTSHQ